MMKAASQPSTIAMKVFLTMMAILFSTPAFAHGAGLFLVYVGIPAAIVSYLLSSFVFIISARSGHRIKRFLLTLVGIPLWVIILIITALLFVDRNPNNEVWWSIFMPISLFLATCIFSWMRSKNEKCKFTIQSKLP